VPQPNSQRYFYVFSTDASENIFQNGLRYSIVDICLDGGIGGVMPAHKNIKLIDTTNEKLICIRHTNGNDYWIISHLNNSDAFCAFRLTSSGMVDTIISHTGTFDMNSFAATGGQMVATLNGLKIAYAKPSTVNGFTLLLDFDPSTGIVSNEQTLNTLNTEYAVAFSSDNSKLYFSTVGHGEIYQYNLNAGNLSAILASKTYIIVSGPDGWEGMQLAPDGKIYISRAQRTDLSAIANPDSLCPACNYIENAVSLGSQKASFCLPNFIAGFNYSNTTYNCESGIYEQKQNTGITIYPNPATDNLTIETHDKATIEILNIEGEIIKTVKNNGKETAIDLRNLSSGIYIIKAKTERGVAVKKFIKE